MYYFNENFGKQILPVDIVLSPEWWYKHEGITFDEDFFYNPNRRIEVEQKMEQVLYKRWGKWGLGKDKDDKRPEIGAVHLAAGFLVSEMLGCNVIYSENHPPQVVSANINELSIDINNAFNSPAYKKLINLFNNLKIKKGYLTGDINWGGILNIALDLRGNELFIDMMTNPLGVQSFFNSIAEVIEKFTTIIENLTGTTSISVNRVVKHLKKPVLLHSECSHTMISVEDYENFLLPFDIKWSNRRPFGVHYCGNDPHRMAPAFAKIPNLDFLDVGWGGDIKILRQYLPHTFFNIRLSPVELVKLTNEEIRNTIIKLVNDSENPYLTGVCCINIDDTVTDDKIDTIFCTVDELKKQISKELNVC